MIYGPTGCGNPNLATPKDTLLSPSLSTLVKLGSIAVHVDELFSSDGHEFDKLAIQNLLNDSEVVEWLAGMQKLAMLPVKRNIK
jgi:hypothetical protein